MKIAVTFDRGEIFQHFGHTEEFKVYEIADGKIQSSEVIRSNGSGHGALALLLRDEKIDVLICGGIGGGAQAALAEQGIELCAGASGNADKAVELYLKGEPDPNAIFTVEISKMPGSESLSVDDHVLLQNMYGQPFPVKVTAKDETTITFDANHEMAGKELNFHIELLEVL